jgi:TonB family protein
MRRTRPVAAAMALSIAIGIGMAQPTALLCQDNSTKETYDGEPLCQNRRGVFPHPTYRTDPEYDDKDRKAKTQGTVVLSVIVTKDGNTADIKVTKSLTPGLDQQAIKCVSRWRFEPVIQDGKICPAKMAIEVSFHLY